MSIAEKLTTIAENEPKVYEAGKQAEHDAMWDGLQNFGSRTDYSRWCKGCGKLDDWFYPKYHMQIDIGSEMFRGANCSTGFDLAKRLEDCGVVLDTSKCTNAQMMFTYCNVKRLPTLDFSSITTASGIQLAFTGCSYLEDVRLSGTLSVANFDVSACAKLNKESIVSIINALSTATSGLTVTLSKTAVETAFGSTTASEWTTLIGTRDNWTISLA